MDAHAQSHDALLPRLVTDEQIAAWLGVTVRTVQIWTRLAKLPPPVKLGKSRAPKRWLAEDVAAWIKAQRSPEAMAA